MTHNSCGIAGCVNPGCEHATASHVKLPSVEPHSACFACLKPGIQQMSANAQKMQAEQPANPWTPVFGEFAAACAAFVEEASAGNATEQTLTRLADAVEAIGQEKTFQNGPVRGNA